MEAMQITVEAASVDLCNALSAGAEHGCASSTGSLRIWLLLVSYRPLARSP